MLNSRHRFTMSDGYSFNLKELTVTMPTVRQRWALRKSKRNLTPVLVPTFRKGDQPLANLYIGRDYTVAFMLGREDGGTAKAERRLKTVTHAGRYYALVTGVSAHLRGETVVPFTVERRSLLPVVIIVVALLIAVAVAVFLFGAA